jgi:hypothetical protein
MIQDEEEKSRARQKEIAKLHHEGPPRRQSLGADHHQNINQFTRPVPTPGAFQSLNYLDEQKPLPTQL